MARRPRIPALEPVEVPASPARRPGRPTAYAPEIAAAILERLSGGEALWKICADEGMPAKSTVRLWQIRSAAGFKGYAGLGESGVEEFSVCYARAYESWLSAQTEDMLEVAENEPDPARARVLVDTIKWTAERRLHGKYGRRIQVDLPPAQALPEGVETPEQAASFLGEFLGRLVGPAKTVAPFGREDS